MEEELIAFSRFIVTKTHTTWTVSDKAKPLIDKIKMILAACELIDHCGGLEVREYCKDRTEYAMKH